PDLRRQRRVHRDPDGHQPGRPDRDDQPGRHGRQRRADGRRRTGPERALGRPGRPERRRERPGRGRGADLRLGPRRRRGRDRSAEFGYAPSAPVEGQSVQFSDGSSDPDVGDAVVSWSWSFGDGSAASTTRSPAHVYAADGAYEVTLTVADRAGNRATRAR